LEDLNLDEITYECNVCGERTKKSDDKIPECCNKPMKKIKLDICTQPEHAEHSRPMEEEDACDDFRGG
jgi:hypothetical protein